MSYRKKQQIPFKNKLGSFSREFRHLKSWNSGRQNHLKSRFSAKEEKIKLIREYESLGAPISMFCTWRGRSEFQKYLVKCGIEHLRSRPDLRSIEISGLPLY
jgi:hypothetical protein